MQKAILGIAAIITVVLVAGGVFAYGHMPHNDAVRTAIQSGDYQAYTQAMAANNLSGKIPTLTQDQFDAVVAREKQQAPLRAAFDKAHQAVKDKNYDAWKSAMTEVSQLQVEQLTQEQFNELVKRESAHNETSTPGFHPGFGMRGHHRPMDARA